MKDFHATIAKPMDKDTALAVIDLWLYAYEQGYTMTIKTEGEEAGE